MRRQTGRAFTLLEVLLVIVLLGVLFAFAWPDFAAATEGERLKESAQRMRALIAMCRAEAMNETVCYRIKIRLDGGVRVHRQADALLAPQLYITPRAGWARQDMLLEDVWVEAVQDLPEGPPPIQIIDEKLEFPEMAIEPQRI
jgi:prepilin-type N-terminal cleavage/methylation domain-containing protein